MSKTLSTNVTNGKAGDSFPVWLLEVESSASTYRWSTFSTSGISGWSGSAFDGSRLAKNGFSTISESCDITLGGNIQELSGMTFRLDNTALYSDTLATEYFDNRRAELRLIFADQTSPSWANATPVFYGFVDNWVWDDLYITFTCRRAATYKELSIPSKRATKNRYPTMPNENEGKYFGIVFGDFQDAINRNAIAYSGLTSSAYSYRDYVRGLVMRKQLIYSADGAAYVALAEHELHTTYPTETTEAARIYMWDSTLESFISVEKDTTDTTNSGFTGMEGRGLTDVTRLRGFHTDAHYSSAAVNAWAYVVPIFEDTTSSGSGFANENYCTNEDTSDKTTVTTAATVLSYMSPTYDTDAWVWGSVKLYFTRDGDETVSYEITASGCATLTGTISTFGSTQSVSLTGSGWSSGTVVPALSVPVKIKLTFNQVGGAFGNVYVNHIHLAASRPIPFASVEPQLYQSVKGRAFKAYIDDTNHSNSYSAGGLIENPAGIIESILVEDCGLTTYNTAGKAVEFDGSNDELWAADSDSLSLTGDFSFTTWVYVDTNTGGNGIIRKCNALAGTGSIANPFDWYIDSSGNPVLKIGDGASEVGVTASGTITTGTWQHLAVVWDGSQIYHYLNSADNGSGSPAPITPSDGGFIVEIGSVADASAANASFDGKIDELCVFNYAMSSADVVSDYKAGAGQYHSPGQTGLVACWHFDEGSGRMMKDYSGLDNNVGPTGNSITSNVPAWAAGKVAKAQQIAETKFDSALSLKANWNFARQITEPQKVKDLLRELCYESGLAQLTRYDGLESISRIDYESSAVTLTTSSYLMKGNNTTFKIDKVPLRDVYSEFILYYQENYGSGNFDRVVYVKNPQSAEYDAKHTNLTADGSTYWGYCSDAYANYKTVNRWEYKAKWIRETATAERFLKFMIAKLTRRPYIVEFETTLNHIDLELMDTRKFAHALLPAAVDSTNLFKLYEIETNPNTNTLRLKWYDTGTSVVEPS